MREIRIIGAISRLFRLLVIGAISGLCGKSGLYGLLIIGAIPELSGWYPDRQGISGLSRLSIVEVISGLCGESGLSGWYPNYLDNIRIVWGIRIIGHIRNNRATYYRGNIRITREITIIVAISGLPVPFPDYARNPDHPGSGLSRLYGYYPGSGLSENYADYWGIFTLSGLRITQVCNQKTA
jgi:hypothetical protein